MNTQTYTIELKLRAGEDGHEAMTQIVKQLARDLLASGMLLSTDKAPQVIARSTDAFYSTNEIEALEPSEGIGE